MTQSKTYKSRIAAKFGILFNRIKNKFNGSKLVVENYTIKYNTKTKEYTVVMNFMTEAEEAEFNKAIAEQQVRIMEMMTLNEAGMPTLERQVKAEKWADAVEKNRQKQLAENKSKKKPTEKIVTDIKNRGVYTEAKPKRKYNKTKKTSL